MRIAEAAALCAITPTGIRYYERIGLINITRDEHGIRIFSTDDVKILLHIKEMKAAGLSIKAMQQYFSLRQVEDAWARRELLIEEYRRLTREMDDLLQKRARLQEFTSFEENVKLVEAS